MVTYSSKVLREEKDMKILSQRNLILSTKQAKVNFDWFSVHHYLQVSEKENYVKHFVLNRILPFFFF